VLSEIIVSGVFGDLIYNAYSVKSVYQQSNEQRVQLASSIDKKTRNMSCRKK